eukprot:c13029_g1_i1.p1 GENE.c13029_g1_i1~~c13029_g1_i1.p1  ORF type:complete len:228 (+),score=46.34 c13029_g1_i1:1-684(+)
MSIFDTRYELARLYILLGEFHIAKAMLERTIEQLTKVTKHQSQPPIILAHLQFQFAELLRQRSSTMKEARTLYQFAIEIIEKVGGDMHLDIAWLREGLGQLQLKNGDYAEAEHNFRLASTIRELWLEPTHLWMNYSRFHLMSLFMQQGRGEDFSIQVQLLVKHNFHTMNHNHPIHKRIMDLCKNKGVMGAPPGVGRNDPCMCGSSKKFKKCCGAKPKPETNENRIQF